MPPLNPLVIASLRGGLSNADPKIAIENDACVIAENLEFYLSMLGERRMGCLPISLPASITGNSALTAVTWAHQHEPTSDPGDNELWVLAQSLTAADNLITRRTKTGWSTVVPVDTPTTTNWQGHAFRAQTLHMKLFLAFKSGVDRLHVWDGTTLRRTGLAEPVVPTAANTAVAGAYATIRYIRYRYIEQNGAGKVLRRSEPSAELAFTPSGAFNGMIVTRGALINEGETHWEVELSTDAANFYVPTGGTIAVGTTTYTDTTAFATGYAAGTLSEDIGEYIPMPSVGLLCADEDRLLGAVSLEDDDFASSVWWTLPAADFGAGNDERTPETITTRVDLDDGGGKITNLVRAPSGNVYAFKLLRVYKFVRTTTAARAYIPYPQTDKMGALPGTAIQAFDEGGRPCLYFLDPNIGMCRIGVNGIEACGYDVLGTWKTVNPDAPIVAHGVYYENKQQLHYWIATNGAQYPNSKIVAQTSNMVSTNKGVRGGWSTVPAPCRIANAHCSTLFSVNIDSTDPRSSQRVPFIGKQQWDVDGTTITDGLVQRCDVGITDAFTTGDTGAIYRGKGRTKPFLPTGLLGKSEIANGTVLAQASAGAIAYVRLIRNFTEANAKPIELNFAPDPKLQQESVIRELSDLGLSELFSIEIEFGDLDETVEPTGGWAFDRLDFKQLGGEKN